MKKKTVARAYAADGVDLGEGDDFSQFAGRICRASYENSPLITIRDWSKGQFRGPRTFRLIDRLLKECELSADPDGNGTKVILTATTDTPEWAAWDLLEMTGMDGVRYGGRPVLLVNQLDVSTLGKTGTPTSQFYRRLMAGLGVAARKTDVVLLKGETAEMGVCVSSEITTSPVKFMWCGTMLSVFYPKARINGSGIRHGNIAVALREPGLRANGGSSARKAFAMKYGSLWHSIPEAQKDIQDAAVPSTSYTSFLTDINGWNSLYRRHLGDNHDIPMPRIKVRAIAHITGGGIPSKLFGDVLQPRGFSAELLDLWEPPLIMHKLASWRGVSGKEPYEIWHGGQGAVVILDEKDVAEFLKLATRARIEAKPVGVIKKENRPRLVIKSKFDGCKLTWR